MTLNTGECSPTIGKPVDLDEEDGEGNGFDEVMKFEKGQRIYRITLKNDQSGTLGGIIFHSYIKDEEAPMCKIVKRNFPE